MKFEDPDAVVVRRLLADCDHEVDHPDPRSLLEHAARKSNRDPFDLLYVAVTANTFVDLRVPSPPAWRSPDYHYRKQLAGHMRFNRRYVASMYKRKEPFTLEDRRHQNPGRPRKSRTQLTTS